MRQQVSIPAVVLAAMALAALGLYPNRAMALSSPEETVSIANRKALDQYTALDFAGAQQTLDEAARFAEQNGVGGPTLARTYLNQAVVMVGGLQDTTEGLNLCLRALEIDPTIALDPAVSTPEMRQVFDTARARMKDGSAAEAATAEPPPDAGAFAGPGNIPHIPVPEQLVRTAVPVFIEVPEDAEVSSVYLYYRGASMRTFRRVEMARVPGGVGFEIPCGDVVVPKMQYYIEAFAPDKSRIGFAGTEQEPVEVPIVNARTQPAPALPGGKPPEQCAAEGSARPADEYRCSTSMDCYEGERCDKGFCISNQGGDVVAKKTDMPRFFLYVGGAFGGGYADSGRPADRIPERADDGDGNYPYRLPGEGGCPADLTGATHCVRVTDPGFVPFGALRIATGYYITPRFALAGFMRYQFNSGRADGSFPAALMFGGRLQFLLTTPAAAGFHSDIYAGFSYGQLQLRPNQAGALEEPYIKSGPAGAQLGFIFGYRFVKNFGLYLTPEVMFQFPTFLVAIEGSGGLELAF